MTRENRDHANLASALADVAAYALTVEDVGKPIGPRAKRWNSSRVGETRVATTCCLQHLGSVAAQRGLLRTRGALGGRLK
jgi:hypothetical protein